MRLSNVARRIVLAHNIDADYVVSLSERSGMRRPARFLATHLMELPRPIPWNPNSDILRGSVYFDNVTLTSYNITSLKPCQYNNKFHCSETNGCNILQDAIN